MTIWWQFVYSNKGLFHVEQIVRGQSNNHSCKNTKEPTNCKNIIHLNKLDRWCLKKCPFTQKAQTSESWSRSQSSVCWCRGRKWGGINNIFSKFCFQGLLKTCLIHDLHIQELRESILFCWVVHQGTVSSLVSKRGVVSSHFQFFFGVGPMLMESIKWDVLELDCTISFIHWICTA